MAEKKCVKEAPSAFIFTSPEKKQVISQLVSARNKIKHKFKQAYKQRIKRERALKKNFKPITKSLGTLKSKKKKKGDSSDSSTSDSDDDSADNAYQTSQFKPKRVDASTPKRGILQRPMFYSDDETSSVRRRPQASATAHSDIFQSVAGSSGIQSKSKSKSKSKSMSFSPIHAPIITRQSLKRLPKLDEREASYKIMHDDDSQRNYDKKPADAMILRVNKTDRTTGLTAPMNVRFIQLPNNMKQSWIKHRKDVYTFLTQDKLKKALQRSSELTSQKYAESNASDASESEVDEDDDGAGASGFGLKNNNKSLDFNFIPYNVNNHIVYEYFDDPNELCDRLQLLVSSRMAGNTNHIQEINSIIEELRELGCIA